MDARELRIGNYVDTMHDGICVVSVIFDTGIKVDIGDGAVQQYSDSPLRPDFAKVQPIPLTEEWLLKFGFTEEGKNWWFKDFKDIEFDIEVSDNQFLVSSYGTQLKYVHQLQNLYFALTGEELKIKE